MQRYSGVRGNSAPPSRSREGKHEALQRKKRSAELKHEDSRLREPGKQAHSSAPAAGCYRTTPPWGSSGPWQEGSSRMETGPSWACVSFTTSAGRWGAGQQRMCRQSNPVAVSSLWRHAAGQDGSRHPHQAAWTCQVHLQAQRSALRGATQGDAGFAKPKLCSAPLHIWASCRQRWHSAVTAPTVRAVDAGSSCCAPPSTHPTQGSPAHTPHCPSPAVPADPSKLPWIPGGSKQSISLCFPWADTFPQPLRLRILPSQQNDSKSSSSSLTDLWCFVASCT